MVNFIAEASPPEPDRRGSDRVYGKWVAPRPLASPRAYTASRAPRQTLALAYAGPPGSALLTRLKSAVWRTATSGSRRAARLRDWRSRPEGRRPRPTNGPARAGLPAPLTRSSIGGSAGPRW